MTTDDVKVLIQQFSVFQPTSTESELANLHLPAKLFKFSRKLCYKVYYLQYNNLPAILESISARNAQANVIMIKYKYELASAKLCRE